MDHKVLTLRPLETRKWLWFLGISFVLVLLVRSIELPYGSILESLFSGGKLPSDGEINHIEESPSGADMLNNKTVAISVNSTATGHNHEGAENEGDFKNNGSVLHTHPMPNGNAGFNEWRGVDDNGTADKRPSIGNVVKVNESIKPHGVYELNEGNALEEAVVPPLASDSKESLFQNSSTMYSNLSATNEKNNTQISQYIGSSFSNSVFSSPAIAPTNSPSDLTSLRREEADTRNSASSPVSNASAAEMVPTLTKDYISNQAQNNLSSLSRGSSIHHIPDGASEVITISEMNELFRQSLSTFHSTKPLWPSKVDEELLKAKLQIKNSPIVTTDADLYGPLYRNVSVFKRSYELMEEMLKVYIYKGGQKPILHRPNLKGIYASEGWFMKLLESNRRFVTKIAKEAHLFYLPFSSQMLEETLYVPNSHTFKNLIQFLEGYLNIIVAKHPFWNRTGGADHFLVACHDWAPAETKQLMANCIRALCNADVKEGFVFGKDVSLPETYVRTIKKPLRDLGGKPPSKRSILAFFAGNMHGYVRTILLQHWGDKDPDMRIFGRMPKVKGNINYIRHMKSSKYCICAKGYEVNSPRVVEAIFYECVPVIISDNFVPPFFETLNWESFAVFVLEKDIPNLKNILLSIPERRYLQMQMRVKKVQRHFLWHAEPMKYDIFHMILHSVWFSRVFQVNSR